MTDFSVSSQDPLNIETSNTWQRTLSDALTAATRIAHKPTAGLYLTATPIGNAADLSIRALATLAGADIVLCEDTRVTHKLLSLYGLKCSLTAYHDHNAAAMRPKIINRLKAGHVIVQVSDAGTPLINDPGYKLVVDALAADITVTTIPGAASPIAALTLAGLPTDRFLYVGFPPAKQMARRTFLEDISTHSATLLVLESVHRLADSIADMADIFGSRQAAVCREMTKKFEDVRRGTLTELAQHYAETGAPKGEVVIVVAPPIATQTQWNAEDVDTALSVVLAQGKTVKDAAQDIAIQSGWKKRDVYARAVALRDQ